MHVELAAPGLLRRRGQGRQGAALLRVAVEEAPFAPACAHASANRVGLVISSTYAPDGPLVRGARGYRMEDPMEMPPSTSRTTPVM